MIKVIIQSENGLHARPASKIVHTCQEFQSEIYISVGTDQANARSIMNLIAIGVQFGDEVIVTAEGIDANQAEEAIAAILGGIHD